jgi:hypothetical protein
VANCLELGCVVLGVVKICVTGLYGFRGQIFGKGQHTLGGKLCGNELYRFWGGGNCEELDSIVWERGKLCGNGLNLYLGGSKLCGTGLYSFGGGKFCGTGLYMFWGAKCMELYCIGFGVGILCATGLYGFGGRQILWNCTV